MDALLKQFVEDCDSRTVQRLVAMSELIKSVPTEKMAKVKSLQVTWTELEDELLPNLSMEFFE